LAILLTAVAVFFSQSLFLQSAYAQVPVQECGVDVDADIVVMLDVTGSQSAADIQIEKDAMVALLDFFSAATIKPRIAIGSFNCPPTTVANPCTTGAARILPGGSLTNSYGDKVAKTGLYGVIDALVGELPNGDGRGRTNLEAAINVAQAELATSGLPEDDYLILVTDGIPNRPDDAPPGSCVSGNPDPFTTCNCLPARTVSSAAATAAETSLIGTTIFTIGYIGNAGGSSCNANDEMVAANFLQNEIASDPSRYFEGNADLSGIFEQIMRDISCDDNNPCTLDNCDEQQQPFLCVNDPISALQCDCENTPNGTKILDSFGACCEPADIDDCGVCNGNNADLNDCGVCFVANQKDTCGACPGEPNYGDTTACEDCNGVPNGTSKLDDCGVCVSANQPDDANRDDCGVCFGNNADKDDCGVCSGSNSAQDLCGVCFGDNSLCGNVCEETVIADTLFALDGLGRKALLNVRRLVKDIRRATGKKRSNRSAIAEAAQLYQTNWQLTWSIPTIIKSDCSLESLCVTVSNTEPLNQYELNHQRLTQIANQLIKKLKRLGVRTKRAKKRTEKIAAEDDALILTVPTTSQDCSS
ncbi:MAG: VWA domain-containing protein, partial [Bdellovibrionales bacterium]|nr:VWA domain-containing protein [Bdellovibrionales bacterium]